MPDRLTERDEIRRRLAAGRSIQMPAPRRVGKTWLMRRVEEDLAGSGWVTVFIDAEGLRAEDEFLRALCREIDKADDTSNRVFAHLSHRLKKIVSEGWDGNPVNAIGRIDPKQFAEELIASLDAQGRDTLILVDEIALFVTVLFAKDANATRDFLYHLRKLRQAYPRVRWLLTGSIGLDVVARRGRLQGAFVDLDVFALEPFTISAARTYLDRVCGTTAVRRPFALDDAGFVHLVRELGWLSPYYLDMVVDRIQASGPSTESGLTLALPADIERAFDDILAPPFRVYFATWEEHLDKNFPPDESTLLYAIVGICCEQPDGETFATIQARPGCAVATRALKDLLTALAADGILHEVDGRWRFRSGLLRRYWSKYHHE